MGCDIHAAIEFADDGKIWTAVHFQNPHFGRWKNEPPERARLDFGRNYDAFAILANVRNGYGCAGVETSDTFTPISNGRGLPADISEAGRAACNGDHSATWVSLDELMAYDWTWQVRHVGWVNAKEFANWDRMREWAPRPASYCGDITGQGIVHADEESTRALLKAAASEEEFIVANPQLYTKVMWHERCAETAGELWTRWVPEMLRWRREHQYVRMVMNFDS